MRTVAEKIPRWPDLCSRLPTLDVAFILRLSNKLRRDEPRGYGARLFNSSWKKLVTAFARALR
jgi:hypothetical protein